MSLSLLRIRDFNKNEIELTHIIDCKENLVYNHSINVENNGTYLNIATTENDRKKSYEYDRKIHMIRLPI